jgi:hypothetical protein
MSDPYYAGQSARIAEICLLARDEMWSIKNHARRPVDRVALAQRCRDRMANAAWVLSRHGLRGMLRGKEELAASIKPMLEIWPSLCLWELKTKAEPEWLIELEIAKLVTEAIAFVVDANALKISQLKELRRALYNFDSRTCPLALCTKESNAVFSAFDEKFVIDIQSRAFFVGMQLDVVQRNVLAKEWGLRRCRRQS